MKRIQRIVFCTAVFFALLVLGSVFSYYFPREAAGIAANFGRILRDLEGWTAEHGALLSFGAAAGLLAYLLRDLFRRPAARSVLIAVLAVYLACRILLDSGALGALRLPEQLPEMGRLLLAAAGAGAALYILILFLKELYEHRPGHKIARFLYAVFAAAGREFANLLGLLVLQEKSAPPLSGRMDLSGDSSDDPLDDTVPDPEQYL